MSRTIEFSEDKLVLHLTGFTSVAALRRHVEIPYSKIVSVAVDDFEISLLKIRIGTSISDIREGKFLIGDRWCFVSYEDHKDVVILELSDHEFGKVVFQTENPEETRQCIMEYMAAKE